MNKSDYIVEQMIREYNEEKPVAIVLSIIGASVAIVVFLIYLVTTTLRLFAPMDF